MQTRKPKWSDYALLGAVVAIGLVYLLPAGGHDMVLSESRLASLCGRHLLHEADTCSSCMTDVDCEDIQCSICYNWEGEQKYCEGNTGETDHVEACYAVSDPDSSCSYSGDPFGTTCNVDAYSDASCATLIEAGASFETKNCD
ncbi:MAG: hypothetical protein JSU94_17695 [Phycisphaerales bacterium]|nr:MAG: hypothetical protein JSW47_17140 [Phycisphaerales bacterium]UCG47312.1 MAG: hypothetical protein JSU94_17695 [Phycisphaerales bacterium]